MPDVGTALASATPLAEGLFTWPSDSPALIGTKCGSCGEVTFPSHYGCPRCASEEMATIELGRTGMVWTWTTQNFRPPPPYSGPEEFVPYHVGYVELPGEVIVESYLTGYGDGHPVIGDAVELTIIPFSTNEAGDQVVTYAFQPVSNATAGEAS
jgi:uncharacterized OB-fold protein